MRNSPGAVPSFNRLQQAGLGIVDVLIALLLLSLALLSAGAATLRALQAGRSATLQMRAADLAADLHEDLETLQDASTAKRIVDWQQRVAAALPAAAATTRSSPAAAPDIAVLSARLQWQEPADAALEMPVPLPLRAGIDP